MAETIGMYSFKYNVFRTLRCYNTRPLQDIFKISLWCAVLLALRRPFGHELDGVHLRPPDLDAGEGHARALDADRPLDDVQPRTGIHQPLQESEVTVGYSFGRPQTGLLNPSWPVQPPYAARLAVSADQ